MKTPARLGFYVLGLAAAFGAALGVGALVGPTGSQPASEHADMKSGGHGDMKSGAHDEMAGMAHELPGGLSISADGYTLRPAADTLPAGRESTFRFTITNSDGRPVTAFTRTHEKLLHLIIVRRDTSGFQHLHPTLGPDGVWSVPLRLPNAGDYRVFADFAPSTKDPITLGADLHAAGAYRPVPLPEPSSTATVDGYTVTVDGDLKAGASSMLTLSIERNGRPVTDLQPYLGAYGHLVALRHGDLAYLHVHPDGEPGDGHTRPGPRIRFHAEVPTAGSYRLYLDFRHGGAVHTAEFTMTAGGHDHQ
ncbi:MAG TPA: hypothetical protein VHC49_25670 [Mycobacteriales bacterium]|nr:hypothetical protein [Mycobacteriales bacterium]